MGVGAVSFDGSGSTDADGTIISYVWDFGDGSTGSGMNVTHTYAAEGTYDATLTVTDDRAEQTTSEILTIQVEPDPNYLSAPTVLTASVDGYSVVLSWKDNSSNETEFIIERAVKIRGKYNFLLHEEVPADSLSYIDESVEVGSYKYRVSSSNGSVTSDYSNEASVKVETTLPTAPEPVTLSAPSLSATVTGLDVTLNWSDECPADVEECIYHVEKGIKITGKISFSEIGALNETFSTDNVGSAGTYYYQVYVTAGADTSDSSNIVTVRIK